MTKMLRPRSVAVLTFLAGLPATIVPAGSAVAADQDRASSPDLVFACAAGNDLYETIRKHGISCRRFDGAAEAVAAASPGSGLLVLADGYPDAPAVLEAPVIDAAARKGLRVFVEYPGELPGSKAKGRKTLAYNERCIVASDFFGSKLPGLSILEAPGAVCQEFDAPRPILVSGQVAGYDRAAFGLADVAAAPLLFEMPKHGLLVCATSLSNWVVGRYAPYGPWQEVLRGVLRWLAPGLPEERTKLDWRPTVRPTFGRDAAIGRGEGRAAAIRGGRWFERFLVDGSWVAAMPWEFGPPLDLSLPMGDGTHGILEGHSSRLRHDGRQVYRYCRRADCQGESSLPIALTAKLSGEERYGKIAANLLDYLYRTSSVSGGPRRDPGSPDYGQLGWGDHDTSNSVYYSDDAARALLGSIGAAAVLRSNAWTDDILRTILANYRTTGRNGFRPGMRLDRAQLAQDGWETYYHFDGAHYSPHYHAYIWCAFLWLHEKTRYEPLYETVERGAALMMAAYPDRWEAEAGRMEEERIHMLLPLAWLLRAKDTPEHRAWLDRIVRYIEERQAACGAVPQQIARSQGRNGEYGTQECPVGFVTGDPVTDLLYSMNFAMIGMHEAAAAVPDEPRYRKIADRMADLLVRIQIASEDHRDLDGGWFRGFDFERWEYWGANGDLGWGVWGTLTGWTQSWIVTALALRELETSLWDLGRQVTIDRDRFESWRRTMLPDAAVRLTPGTIGHEAVGKAIALAIAPSERYAAAGPGSLVDGRTGRMRGLTSSWLGFEGTDLRATIDLGEPAEIHEVALRCLQFTAPGIYVPKRVVFGVSLDGKDYRQVAVEAPATGKEVAGPAIETISTKLAGVRARYIRVDAENIGKIPAGHPASGQKAWLFVDEVLVDP